MFKQFSYLHASDLFSEEGKTEEEDGNTAAAIAVEEVQGTSSASPPPIHSEDPSSRC
jgi:hypothetical protein